MAQWVSRDIFNAPPPSANLKKTLIFIFYVFENNSLVCPLNEVRVKKIGVTFHIRQKIICIYLNILWKKSNAVWIFFYNFLCFLLAVLKSLESSLAAQGKRLAALEGSKGPSTAPAPSKPAPPPQQDDEDDDDVDLFGSDDVRQFNNDGELIFSIFKEIDFLISSFQIVKTIHLQVIKAPI